MAQSRGWAIWLTGLPASGKTTIARALKERLREAGVVAAVLDSDDLRPILMPGSAYTPAERDMFYLRLVSLAGVLTSEGINCIIAATGNRRDYRSLARAALHPFAEVWVRCSIEVCQARDPKGLYAQARAGAITSLPGMGADYEPPSAPELTLDSDTISVAQAVEALLAGLAFLRADVWEAARH